MNIIKLCRYVVLVSYLGLLALMISWYTWLAPGENSMLFNTLLFIIPLLFPLKGIVQGNPYTHAWANFIILLYMGHGLTVLWVAPEELWLAIIELILVTICFFGMTFYARYQGKAMGLGLKKKSEQS